jgi:hypothetical protein
MSDSTRGLLWCKLVRLESRAAVMPCSLWLVRSQRLRVEAETKIAVSYLVIAILACVWVRSGWLGSDAGSSVLSLT